MMLSAPKSVLDGVSSAMPALLEAHKLSSKAAGVGFDWPNMAGLFDKLREETEELQKEIKHIPASVAHGVVGKNISSELQEKIEGEVGDLFFVLVNLASFLSVDSESALKKTNRKFRRRFQRMEQQLQAAGRTPEQSNMEEMEALWQSSKRSE